MGTKTNELVQKPNNDISALFDIDVERAVISAIIDERRYFDSVSDLLREDSFSDKNYHDLYIAVKSIADSGNHPDMIAVNEKIKSINEKITAYDVAQLATNKKVSNVRYACQILESYRKKRAAYYCGMQLAADAMKIDEDINVKIADATKRLNDELSAGVADDVTMNNVFDELLADIKDAAINGTMKKGSRTGFHFIDDKGGLKFSNLIVVAAESSHGKSSLALCFCLNALLNGARVAFYSLEMPNKELVSRVVSMRCNVSSSDMLYQRLTAPEIADIESHIDSLRFIGDNMHFDDRATNGIDAILSSIRNKKRKYNIDGVIVDYLQILNVNQKSTNKEQAMADVARELKNIAKELNIWVVALSQLNRDKLNPIPTIDRLRDSGQIAEAADEVYLIYRPSQANRSSYPEPFEHVDVNGTAELIRAKGRNVGIGKWIIGFDEPHTKFYQLDSLPEISFATGTADDMDF